MDQNRRLQKWSILYTYLYLQTEAEFVQNSKF